MIFRESNLKSEEELGQEDFRGITLKVHIYILTNRLPTLPHLLHKSPSFKWPSNGPQGALKGRVIRFFASSIQKMSCSEAKTCLLFVQAILPPLY